MRSPVVALVALVALASCAQDARRVKRDRDRPQHLVVLIHGIAGEPSDFGAMEPALERHLATADDRYAWEVIHFRYDTEDRKKSTQRFARDFGAFLKTQLLSAGPEDRFSVVCHSQGGLVTSLLVANSLAGLEGFTPALMGRMDAWVTLGTPFWGAKSATFATPLAEVVNRAGEVLPGNRQLQDMSFGSDTIYALRHGLRLLNEHDALGHVRALNLAGYVPGFAAVAPFSAGSDEFEDDTAVLVPSARMDFLYVDGVAEPGDLAHDRFQQTHLGSFGLVVGLHWLPFEHVQSLVDVPERCVEHAGCDHPTFGYVLRHLLGDEVRVQDTNLRKMTAFLLDVNVELAEGHGLTSDAVDLRFGALPRGVEIARALEMYSSNEGIDAQDPRHLRVTLTGTIEGAWDGERFRDTVLPMTVHVPGYKPRAVEVKARPSWSTFVDLKLAPLAP